VAIVALAGACARGPARDARPALGVRVERVGDSTELTLEAPPGVRINARLAPALELAPGPVVRFGSAALTPDSAYFAAPPSARISGHPARVRGVLRASVCTRDERVCRPLLLALDLRS
jgi:hypothetical protein